MFIPNREELAWAAGFFDGEGCFQFAHKKKLKNGKTKGYPQACITQVGTQGRELLAKFQKSVSGFGNIYGPYAPPPKGIGIWQDRWQWEVNGFEKVQALLAMLWFQLGPVKKAKAKLILAR